MELSFGIQHYAGKVRSCDFYLVQIIVAWSLFAFKPEFMGFFLILMEKMIKFMQTYTLQ